MELDNPIQNRGENFNLCFYKEDLKLHIWVANNFVKRSTASVIMREIEIEVSVSWINHTKTSQKVSQYQEPGWEEQLSPTLTHQCRSVKWNSRSGNTLRFSHEVNYRLKQPSTLLLGIYSKKQIICTHMYIFIEGLIHCIAPHENQSQCLSSGEWKNKPMGHMENYSVIDGEETVTPLTPCTVLSEGSLRHTLHAPWCRVYGCSEIQNHERQTHIIIVYGRRGKGVIGRCSRQFSMDIDMLCIGCWFVLYSFHHFEVYSFHI